ncbi:hypothetical protein AB0K15_46280 [Amycolatopsis sp. NPDC049253]|uniref:hypothetical protein n=1 Tax=Amycolatopsis sp. NPDC049253 TaxID=3155274 RepID=UPI00342A3F91
MSGQFSRPPAMGAGGRLALPWDHLMYAYLMESTGEIEMLREVVRRYVAGETLEATADTTDSWMPYSEKSFFRDPPLFTPGSSPRRRVSRRPC